MLFGTESSADQKINWSLGDCWLSQLNVLPSFSTSVWRWLQSKTFGGEIIQFDLLIQGATKTGPSE